MSLAIFGDLRAGVWPGYFCVCVCVLYVSIEMGGWMDLIDGWVDWMDGMDYCS